MKFLALAFRNVFRNSRRTALTLLVITFGATALILAGGFFLYNYEGLRETSIRNGLGHLQIYTRDHLDKSEEHPLQYGINHYRELQEWLEGRPHVMATTAQVDFVGLISNGEKSEAFLGNGVEPDRETLLGFSLNLKEGEPLSEESSDAGQVILGTLLAKSLNAKVGDVLTVMSTTTDGALNAIDVKVVGMYSTGIKEYDARSIRMPLQSAQHLLESDRVSKVIVKLDATRNTEMVRDELAAAKLGPYGAGLEMKTWQALATFYNQVVSLYNSIFVFVGAIIVILVVLSSSNTMMMSVYERVREIGTLMALGTRRRQVLTIFVLEGFLIGVLGATIGLAVSYGLIGVINHAGLMMPPPPSFNKGFPLLVKFVPELFAAVFFMMVALLTVAALVPAARGSRLEIVDALGHV